MSKLFNVLIITEIKKHTSCLGSTMFEGCLSYQLIFVLQLLNNNNLYLIKRPH